MTASSPRPIHVSAERLREMLSYDPETGVFIWRINPTKRIKAGTTAGYNQCGYDAIGFEGRAYLSHRLAWFYVYGVEPVHLIDHINGDKKDNRIANLREATASQNLWNMRKSSRNTSGYTGVVWHPGTGKWRAQSRHNGKPVHLGVFENALDAAKAHEEFIRAHRGEFVRKTEGQPA